MYHQVTETQKQLTGRASTLAQEEFKEKSCTWEGSIPWENVQKLVDEGIFAMSIPEKYGGGGLTELDSLLLADAIGRVCPDTAAYELSSMLVPRAVAKFGSEAVKEKYLPGFCGGEYTWAIGISEPESGSDVTSMKTKVEEDDNGDLYLSGEKMWVGRVGDENVEAIWIWTRFPEGNIGSVMIDGNADNIEILDQYTNMAGKTQTHFSMENILVPDDHVLIREKEDMRRQLSALNWERCAVAMRASCNSRCALEYAIDWAETREQFDKKLNEFQGMRWKFSDMVKEYEAARSLIYRAAYKAVEDNTTPTRLDSSIAKLYAAESAERIVSNSLQVFGARGYQRGHPLEYLYRLQRGRRISHGTDEILKNGIADQVFKHGLGD